MFGCLKEKYWQWWSWRGESSKGLNKWDHFESIIFGWKVGDLQNLQKAD